MKKYIHVNQHKIKANRKQAALGALDAAEPVITVKGGRKINVYGYSVEIDGPSRVVYSPCRPLACGATVWVETEGRVVVDGVVVE